MANKNTSRLVARCPNCDELIRRQALPRLGQKIRCGECDEELEVVGLDPLELEWAMDNWDDAEDDEDDDWD